MDIQLNYNIYVPAAALSSFLILFLWLFEISLLLLFSSLFAFSIGFLICRVLLQNPQYCVWLQHVFANIIYDNKEFLDLDNVKDNETKSGNEQLPKHIKRDKETDEPINRPWDQLKLDESFNHELDEFFKTLVINYVNNWYNDKLSEDESFTSEIRQLIRHSSAKILKTFLEADILQIFINELIPVIIAHIERVVRILKEICPERSSFEIKSVSLIESKILEKWPSDSHFATLSQENQLDYLRALSDSLICKFVDDIRIGGCFVDEEHQKMLNREGAIPFSTKWSCHSSRHFLRELLLSTVLIPIIDFCSDPDSLNYFALSLLNQPTFYDSLHSTNDVQSTDNVSNSQSNNFLNKFCEQTCNHSPDSLLCLKLSDLVRDPYLVKLFEIYIRDFNGPVKYLDCFIQTREIHLKIQKLNIDDLSQQKNISSEEFEEILFATKQLFDNFIYSGEQKNHLIFTNALIEKFENFFETQNESNCCLKNLENLIEGVYQEVYQFLQYNYVIPFYQSENYLGFLCGAPPDVDELIRGIEETCDEEKFPKVLDGSFSLSQFRKKLFNFIAPSREVSTQNSNNSSPFYPSYSTSDLEGFDKDEIIINNMAECEDGENSSTIAMSDMGRNLNKWIVTINGIEQRGGDGIVNPYFVFNIFVERNDLSDQILNSNSISLDFSEEQEEDEFIEKLLKTWNVGHKYSEFYALEDKIKDYYGNSIRISSLPDRKTTLQLLRIGRNNRTLMDSHRIYFERFLQQLIQQPLLKRSDLLYLFLTSEEDTSGFFSPMAETSDSFGSSILSDLNPIRAMRKAAKEKGQNLKPFILNLLANILAPPNNSSKNFVNCSSSRSGITSSQRQHFSNSPSLESKESFNLKRFTLEEEFETILENEKKWSNNNSLSIQNLKKRQNHGNNGSRNSPINKKESQLSNTNEEIDNMWNNKYNLRRNLYEICLFLFTTLGFVHLPIWFEAFLCSLRTFIGYLFSLIFIKKIEKVLEENLLNVNTATSLVKSLNELVNSWNMPSQCPTPSQISVASSAAALTTLLQLDNNKIQEEIKRKRVNTSASEQERLLRTELLLHRLEKKVEELFPCSQLINWLFNKINELNNNLTTTTKNSNSTAIRQLFLCFQMPALNRQLIFVLLDVFVQKIFLNQKI